MDYPKPIVDHATVSKQNMGRMAKAYEANKAGGGGDGGGASGGASGSGSAGSKAASKPASKAQGKRPFVQQTLPVSKKKKADE